MLGDIVIGDKDGIEIIPLEEAEVVLNKVKDVFNFEEETSKKLIVVPGTENGLIKY